MSLDEAKKQLISWCQIQSPEFYQESIFKERNIDYKSI